MGPTNVALVRLYQADQALREGQGRLEAATKDVRVQDRRVRDLTEKLNLARTTLREQQSKSAQLDLDLKSRDARIEKLRTQQQNAKNNKEYQAFLVEINTEKVDRAKSEEELLKTMQLVENTQGELKALAEHLTGEEQKAATMKAGVGDKVATLQAEIDSLKPEREQAAAALDKKALAAFDRLADHHDGEAMARLIKPDKRREEYACGACMMDLVTDVYNRLHSRDELVFCPSCRRILYIPEDLPLEQAVHKKKPQKEYRGEKGLGAPVVRQQSAEDVLNSIQVEDDTPTEAAPTEASESQPVSETEETSPNTNL